MMQNRPGEPVSPVAELPVEPPTQPVARRRRRSKTRNTVEWVVIIGGAILVALLVKTFLLQAFYIPSGSMIPTLKLQDRVLVNKLSYDLHDVHRGDIVVFKSPEGAASGTKDLIKRVIALPNETVEGRDGTVWVNGKVLEEDYLPDGITTVPFPPTILPDGHYWMMGDNRSNSKDSRSFGPIRKSSIVGRAFIRVWPLRNLHLL